MTGREVINLGDGGRLGFIEECELVFEGSTGRIAALVVPQKGWISSLWGEGRYSSIPWHTIKRIGDEVIIVDLNNAYERMRSIYSNEEK